MFSADMRRFRRFYNVTSVFPSFSPILQRYERFSTVFADFTTLAMHVFVDFTGLRRFFNVFASIFNVTYFVDFSNVCEKNQKIEHFFKSYTICVYKMYECVPRKMTKSLWRSTKPVLPLYARRIEFDQKIRDFDVVYAAVPKVIMAELLDPLVAMEEGITVIKATEIAPSFKDYVMLLLRAAQYDPDDVYRAPEREPDHESDDEMYV